LRASLLERKIPFRDVTGAPVELAAAAILRAVQPNDLSILGKMALFLSRFWGLLADAPREANTEGGLFPAIFGTALMVLIMSLFATPLGVVVAVYLHEYTRGGWLVRIVRITVNNLAGVPSIVYGIFGLQFFVYGIGGSLDELFFSDVLPSPTFGTGGLLWASLTMALLTLPVVIVATEEGLTAVPKGMREGALALGASQWQTLWRVVLPMSSPGILTGVILSIARAAGEVAPLMLVGVIKLAPHLALDGQFPYFHPERKFMHLGFHIYDVGFQSPNVDAAIPMVYVTTFFLLALVLGLNAFAMILRQRLRSRFQGGAF
jgi:phosphate transport system permease protein